MKKVLVLSDASCGITGFSCVAYNILKSLHDSGKYDIFQVGVNYDGDGYDATKIPYKIIPATSALDSRYKDLYGRQRALDVLRAGAADIFFCIQDMAVVGGYFSKIAELQEKLPKEKKFTTIFYTPVDSPLATKRKWVVDSASFIDYPVTYTDFGAKEIAAHDPDLAERLRVCPHGVDTFVFKPLPKEKTQELRMSLLDKGEKYKDKFIILNVNRNQIRKDYTKTFKTIQELKKRGRNVLFIAYAAVQDQGGDLIELATQCGLKLGEDWLIPGRYSPVKGYTVEQMNELYNIADCVFSSSVGEGWGLSSTEAMAAMKPCVFPGHTSLNEIFGADGERGRLIKNGSTPDQWVSYGVYDSSLIRPTIDVMDAASKIEWVMDNPKEAKAMAARAYDWAQMHTWARVNEFWLSLFQRASDQLDRKRNGK